MTKYKTKSIGFASTCVHDPEFPHQNPPHQLPIYATSSFVFDTIDQGRRIFTNQEEGHVYSRYGNPTLESVASKIASLESHGMDIVAKAFLCSTGMAAISSLFLTILSQGDQVLTQGNLYGGTTELINSVLTRGGIKPIFTRLTDLDQVELELKSNPAIKLIYCESPANPTLACVDIGSLSDLAKKYGVQMAIDNTFSTPYLQQPFELGVDHIIHSTTKYLNGHGNSIMGVVISRHPKFIQEEIFKTVKLLGTSGNAFDAWLLNNGLKTLAVRMDKHCSNAMAVAQFLEEHPRVTRVNYPGLPSHPSHLIAKSQMKAFGGMLSFEVDGGLQAGIDVMNKINFCALTPTLGNVDTLILHPASMSHLRVPREIREEYGITDGLIRVSVGIEDTEDIIGDLEQALA